MLERLRFLASLPLAGTAQTEGGGIRVANNGIISHPFRVYPVPKAKQGDWVMKMAIRAAIVSRRRKDFGGARILAAQGFWRRGRRRGRGPRGERGAEGLDRGSAAA